MLSVEVFTHWCIQLGPRPAQVHCSAVRSGGAWQYLTLEFAHANQAQESLGPDWKECKANTHLNRITPGYNYSGVYDVLPVKSMEP